MDSLVTIINNHAFTDSMIIAKGTGNQHKSVSALIKKHKKRFLRWGKLRFSDLKSLNPRGGRPTKVYQLNEEQAYYLMTLLDNTDVVADFKAELVDQFFKMKRLIKEKGTSPWKSVRSYSKKARRLETDVIKKFLEYARSQGSKHYDRYYTNFSSMANKLLGIEDRDSSTIDKLNQLAIIETLIASQIQIGMAAGQFYKDIFKTCKRKAEEHVGLLVSVENLIT